MVDYRFIPARTERRCAARLGLIAIGTRQFCTPNLTMAPESRVPIYCRICFEIAHFYVHVYCTHWPVPVYIKNVVVRRQRTR